MIGIAFSTRGADGRRARSLKSLIRMAAAWAMVLCFAAGLAAPASGQIPKAFKYYEDTSDLGFKIKIPSDWVFIPGTPADLNLIGKYDVDSDQGIAIGNYRPWTYSVWLVKFDRRKSRSDAPKEEGRIIFPGAKNIDEYIRGSELSALGHWKKVDKEGGPLGIAGVEGNSMVYEVTKEKVELRLYVAAFKLADDLDVALIANCPGDPKKYSKFEGALNTMGRSFKRLELRKAGVASVQPGDSPLRSQTRAALDAKIKLQPGWKLYETPNYFIVSNNPDKAFIDELMSRLEAIRKSYEETYPVDKALELRKRRNEAMAKRKAEAAASGKTGPESESEEGEEGDEAPSGKTEAKKATPLEQSRCSVVRVVQNADQYHSYGGPPSSAGYWNWVEQELVVYDDKAVGGRGDTWATLNHEAFHQYIFYLMGNLSPHSWYNEGNGDYYAGYQLKNSRFELKPFDWRLQTIKSNIRQRGTDKESFVPLKEMVRYTQDQYYDRKNGGKRAGANYAQGWSMIWFLREGPKNYRGWNKAWTPILDVYLETLAVTNDLDQAVDQAFAGVDWDELEKAWIDYTLAI